MVFFEVREVAGVCDEGREVKKERQEEPVENRIEVAYPHEVNKDADLVCRKNLIIARIGQNFDEARSIISNEDPVEVKDLGFNLLEVRLFSFMGYRLDLIRVVLEWRIINLITLKDLLNHIRAFINLVVLFVFIQFFFAY